MTSIRGATTAPENTAPAILAATEELLRAMLRANAIEVGHIVDVLFSATQDLDAVYPAVAARNLGMVEAGLFCVQEMAVPGSLPRCIRILLHAEAPKGQSQAHMRHIYLREATALRPDLTPAPSTPEKGRGFAVAIDGPSGAGKSTAAQGVAATLGMTYVDTGAMYRAVALHYQRQNVDVRNSAAVADGLEGIAIALRHDELGRQRLLLNGEDVTEALRTQQVAEGSSVVASYPVVREKLVALQRALSQQQSVVMDGRDIGSHVLPDAQVKIFLDASVEERVRRRIHELQGKGHPATPATVRQEIETRDERDTTRSASPLVRAPDAVHLVSDGMSAQEIVGEIVRLIHAQAWQRGRG